MWQALGPDAARAYMHQLLAQAVELLCGRWNTDTLAPLSMCASMALVRLPAGLPVDCPASSADAKYMQVRVRVCVFRCMHNVEYLLALTVCAWPWLEWGSSPPCNGWACAAAWLCHTCSLVFKCPPHGNAPGPEPYAPYTRLTYSHFDGPAYFRPLHSCVGSAACTSHRGARQMHPVSAVRAHQRHAVQRAVRL